MTDQLHAPVTLPPSKDSAVPVENEGGWVKIRYRSGDEERFIVVQIVKSQYYNSFKSRILVQILNTEETPGYIERTTRNIPIIISYQI
jgi:hypothetical protein